jgi:hypothetical protein
MKKKYLLLILVLIFSAGCISSPTQAVLFTYTNQHIYGFSNGNQVASGRVLKYGESCSSSSWFFNIFIFYYGSGGSIEEATKLAGITKIAVIDRSSFSILGPIFYRECTIVWGE